MRALLVGIAIFSASSARAVTAPATTNYSSLPVQDVNLATLLPPPIKSSQTVCGVSVQLLAARSIRKRAVCLHHPNNTDFVLMSWGAAATANDMPLWLGAPFDTTVSFSTTSLNAISNSGCQVIRCWDY